ncbi:MAG: DUF3817 domain-containing protein [Rhodobacteraceae bacterium]|nr:DUF3817 domain-containing protein [Paracoccaceae bacterium]
MTDFQNSPDLQSDKTVTGRNLFALFRVIAVIEGVTTLLLFLVAMPIKYGLDDASWVKLMGPLHGYAFLVYIALMLVVMRGPFWRARDLTRAALASLVPFGTFLNDPHLKRRGQDIYSD